MSSAAAWSTCEYSLSSFSASVNRCAFLWSAARAGARTALVAVLFGAAQLAVPAVSAGADGPVSHDRAAFKLLVFSKTLGFRHANIPQGIAAIRRLGSENGFAVEATEDSAVFTPDKLAQYKSVLFLSATGDVLNSDQETALKSYIENGGGFVAIHGALFGPSACEDKWGWYGELCCASFKNHSAVVPARVDVEDHSNPSTAGLPEHWERTDEWYNYEGTPRGKARVLATLDEKTYTGGAVGADHPISWCKRAGKGIMWYTAMGHTDESFREPLFLKHVLGGIELTARVKSGDLAPNTRVAHP